MRRPALRRFESLEPRLALAGLVTFSDVDGDTVTVRTSRGTDVLLSAALTLVPAGVAGGFQLQQVSLFHPSFAGTNLAITARPSATGGNGRVDVGEILTSFDLGTVTVGGDLGRIIAGDGIRATPGVAAFASTSIGSRGTATGSPDTFSLVTGTVPSIRVAGDLVAARFVVAGRAADVVIGGSIFGTNGADGFEAKGAQGHQVAPRAAAEVEDAQGRGALNVSQQCCNVLLHIMVARAFPELFGALAVVFERFGGDLLQVIGRLCHRLLLVRHHLPVDVIPPPRLSHETADLVHFLRTAVHLEAHDEFDHTGVAGLLGVQHFEVCPLDR